MPEYDAVVVGAGVVGLTAALAMGQRNFSVALIDSGLIHEEPLEDNLRVFAINQASRSLFEQLDAWPLIDENTISYYKHMHVWDAQSSRSIDFDARLIARSDLGAILAESVIKRALLLKITGLANIRCFPGNQIQKVSKEDRGVCISSEKESWNAQLLMVADGRQSVTRELLQVPMTSWPYHQHALVATVRTEKTHESTAYQVFNADGPLAFLPLVDPHSCSIVWSTSKKRALDLQSMAEKNFNEELARSFSYKLGQVIVQSNRYQFPLFMQHVHHYARDNWVMLGDAAHTIHPLAGLGLNIGLADVRTLLQLITKVPLSKKTLGSYQRERKYAVWKAIAFMQGLKALFANPLSPIITLRGLGLGVCDRLSPIKRFFIEQANE